MVRITPCNPVYKPWKGHLEGEQPYLEDLLTMITNQILTGMILQVGPQPVNRDTAWKAITKSMAIAYVALNGPKISSYGREMI